jgi:hypothetical protein
LSLQQGREHTSTSRFWPPRAAADLKRAHVHGEQLITQAED